MKQKLRLLMMTLLCAVVSVAWGGNVTISPSQALNGGVDPITVSCEKGDGSSNPAISSGQLRLYQAGSGKTTGNTITFSSENTITSIVFTFANGMTADNGVFSEGSYDSENSTWTGSTNSVTLTVTGTTSGKRIYITEMVVFYEGGKTDIATLNSISPSSLTAGDADVFDLDASFENENYTIAWSCNDDCLSVEDDGSYEAISAGTATVTVTVTPTDTDYYSEVYKSFTVTISPAPVTFAFPWSEDFSKGLEGYVVVDGGSETKLYEANNAGGTAPELLIGKNGGKFEVTIDLKGNYGNMTLTFKANYNRVTVSATGGTVGEATFSNKSYNIPITVAQGTEKLTLTFTNSNSDNVRVDNFNLELSKQDPGLLFAETSFTVEPGADFTAPTLTNPYNLSVVYSSSNEDLAMVDANTGEVIIGDNEGLVTITASFAGNNQYNEGSASYTIQIGTPHGTQDNPYTVAEARAAIDAGTGVEDVYATGTVSKIVTPYNSQFGNITYDISADGTTTGDQLRVYRGKSYNGDNFTSEDDIQVGDVVVIYGNLIKYGDTYEFAQDNQLVKLYREVEPSITVNTTSIDVPAEGSDGTIEVTFTNVDPELAEIEFYEADGTTSAEYDWIAAEISGNNIEYLVDENEGEARTAYFKVHGLDNKANDVYSELITITQAAPVAPGEEYVIDFENAATSYVKWEFTNIVSNYTNSGVTAHGGSKYGSTDGKASGSIKTVEKVATPQNLTCYVSKQSTNTTESTWYIQVSEDGNDWTDVESISASSMAKGEWVELSADLSAYKDVYVRVYYSGSTAIRLIDDLNLSTQAVAPQPYTVTITQPENGEIYVFYNDDNFTPIEDGDQVSSGSEVLISGTTNEGYQIESVTVTDGAGQTVTTTEVEGEEGAAWTFIMPKSDVTIACTVTEIPEPSDEEWVLTPLADLTEDDIFVIVGDNGDTYAMSNDKGTSAAPTAVSVTISGDKITSVVADNIKWNISGNATDGYTFYPNGDEDTWLYTTNSNNGVRVGTSDNKTFTINSDYLYNTATSRYIGIYNSQDWRCYTSINSNIENQTFGFYKLVKPEPQDEPFTFTISDRATDGETCYATIADLGAGYFKVEGNVEVSTVVINENKQLSYPITFKEKDIIPGQGAYLVKGAAGEYTFPTAEEGDVTDLGENMLISSGKGNVSAEDMLAIAIAATNHEGDFKFYKLSLNGKSEPESVGFYWGAANGVAFNYTKAHQAFLAVPQTGESGAGVAAFLFDGDKTGIYNVMTTESESNNDTYTLSGIRVENKQLPKGIYIKNGKKVVVR